MKNFYNERGFQAYIGYYRMAWPFIELSLYSDHLQLNILPLKYVLDYSEVITIIATRNPWFPFVKIFKIIHKSDRVPKDFYYWSFDKEKLREELLKRNLSVS